MNYFTKSFYITRKEINLLDAAFYENDIERSKGNGNLK